MSPRAKLQSRPNYDYTVSIFDSQGVELIFRDLTGSDLEFFEYALGKLAANSTESDRLEWIARMLTHLNTQKLDFFLFTKRVLHGLFEVVCETILCNYATKVDWLKMCFALQDGSFVNVTEMEKVPMSKFAVMFDIHVSSAPSQNPADTMVSPQ